MTYQKDGLVQAADYNTYVGVDPSSSATGFNTVYATGSGRSGYGQLAIPRVLLNNKVTASEWRSLINNMVNVASHQGTTFDTMSLPSTNDLIAAISTTTSPILSLFDLNLPRLYNNRNNAVAQGSLQNYPRTSTTPFSDNLVFTHTITFESGDKARYFFNAGGQISVNFSHPTGAGMNQLWNSLAAACGKLTISTHNSGTITIAGNTYTGLTRTNGLGTPNILVTDSGYHSLLNENKTIFKQFATVGPDSNSLQSYIDVIISTNGTQQANGDAGSILYITTRFVQAGTSQVSAAGSTVTCTVTPPSTTYLQNTWGSIGVTSDCIATNAAEPPPPPPPPPPPVVVTPTSYTLNWTSSNPGFGTTNTLVATLDLVATTDMTLAIPYTSTIAGVPGGTANISITKGQLTGRTTLNLFGATSSNSQAGVITVHSTNLNQTTNTYVSYIVANGITVQLNMARGHTCVELDPITLKLVVNTYSKLTNSRYDTHGVRNSTALDSWLAAVKPGNIIAIGSWDATSLSTSTRTYLKDTLKTVPKKTPGVVGTVVTTTLPDSWSGQRYAHAIIAIKGSTSTTPVELIGNGSVNGSVTATLTAPGFPTASTGGTVTTTSGTLSITSTPSNISLALIGGNQAFTMIPKIDSIPLYPGSSTDGNYTMRTYAVWPTGNTNPVVYPPGPFMFTKTFDVPTAGQYAIVWCVDRRGTVTLDDTNDLYLANFDGSRLDATLPTLENTTKKTLLSTSPYLYNLTQGSHTLRFMVYDPSAQAATNPNGVALVVYNVTSTSATSTRTLTSVLWSTRSQLP